MAAKLQLNNFRISIYIDADGTVTLTDLPPELRDVAEALDPAHLRRTTNPIVPSLEATRVTGDAAARPAISGDLEAGDSHG
jgi:phosphatidate phosphatase APP1